VACTRNPFAVVDTPACLAQDDCDEMFVIQPDYVMQSPLTDDLFASFSRLLLNYPCEAPSVFAPLPGQTLG